MVKSVPEFSGNQNDYVSWRQSATDAYELFKLYAGSCAHYQAVTIIRNKVKGPAWALLTSHNTVLNYDAIKSRFDCTYADRTLLRLLRQELEMIRQREASLSKYYDEVERELTLVTNSIITMLNDEVRADALYAFVSGLKKSLRSLVFPS